MALVGVDANIGINNMASGFAKICRTCATCTDCLMPIFSGEGLLNSLPDKIQRHLPIQVSEWDRLPQQLCRQCANTLLAWHELVKCCTQADAALRTRLQRIKELSAEEDAPTTSGVNITSELIPNDPVEQSIKSAVAPTPSIHTVLIAASEPASKPEIPDTGHYCSYCQARFTHSTLYHDHLTSVHIDRLFHCDECGQYEDRSNLILHMSDHATEYGDEGKTNIDEDTAAETNLMPPPKETSIPLSGNSKSNGLRKSGKSKITTQESLKTKVATNKVMGEKSLKEALKDNTPNEVEEAKALDDKMTLSELKKLKEMNALINADIKTNTSSDSVNDSDSLNKKVDSRFAFSDSDSDNGFGELPESVFEAIEDSRETPDEIVETSNRKRTKIKRRNRVCNICLKEFTVSSSYFYHIKYVHLDNREHKCETCGRRFASTRTLAEHVSVHTGDREHACAHCDKRFRSKAGLYIHIKDIHSATQEKKFVCSQCNKSFRWKQKLILHYRRHRKEKSHVCTACGRGFSARCDLTRHAKTHSEGKPFGCQKCGVHFAQRRYLQNHMSKKHASANASKHRTLS